MLSFLYVAIGGALGAVARYAVSLGAVALWGGTYPLGTLCVNVIGSFVMGLCAAYLSQTALPDALRLLFMTGFLGAFTTFSAYSMDVVNLWQRGDMAVAAGYAALSVLGAVAAFAAVMIIIKGVS